MGVDFNKIFRLSLKYPVKKDAYLLLLAVQLIFGAVTWFFSGYFGISGLEGSTPQLQEAITFMIYFLPLAVVGGLIMVFLWPAFIDNSSQFFGGKKKTILGSIDVSKKRFLPTLGVLAILGAVMLACFGGVILILLAQTAESSASTLALVALGGLWFVAGSIIGFIVLFMAFLSPFICVLEKNGPVESIKKSWKLVNKNKASTLIFGIIFSVIYIGIAIAGSFPEIAFGAFLGTPAALSAESFGLFIIRTVINAYLTLFMLSAVTGFYHSIKK